MKVTLFFDDIEFGSPQSQIIQDWFAQMIADKSTENLTPLRYADEMVVV